MSGITEYAMADIFNYIYVVNIETYRTNCLCSLQK